MVSDAIPVLAILGCHEMGHYFACRRYGVDALARSSFRAPLPLTGTLGAIHPDPGASPTRRRSSTSASPARSPDSWSLLPALFFGMACRHVVKHAGRHAGLMTLGEPLLFHFASWLSSSATIPDGYVVNMHPMAFAAWFGMLATALNLFPIGQLDGGHISYAVARPRGRPW